jgi:ubiquinone/menaquinone biosynthesis C-methylase UbiE
MDDTLDIISEAEIKQQVRQFYDQVGWQELGEGVYQNARYEDLRSVSREYIHRCHLRVNHHLKPEGRYLLDAGSGPIQYPEYLTYSEGYEYRVCADISHVALQEARKRIGDHGLFVVADVANMPFRADVFDGVVSLHTIHHLPQDEHLQAYLDLFRVLMPGCTAVVVNGWHDPPLGVVLDKLRHWMLRWRGRIRRLLRRPSVSVKQKRDKTDRKPGDPKSTFVDKSTPAWLKREVGTQMPLKIWVWRSVSVKVLRVFIHDGWGGRGILRFLFWLEERFPRYFGENGQYPLIVINKYLS